jgi:DNA-directed RNA polymerase subunit RPC12/RpoP
VRTIRPKKHCEKCGGDLFKATIFIDDETDVPPGYRGIECLNCRSVRLIKTRMTAKRKRREALLLEIHRDYGEK